MRQHIKVGADGRVKLKLKEDEERVYLPHNDLKTSH
jgi:hypothetical protein